MSTARTLILFVSTLALATACDETSGTGGAADGAADSGQLGDAEDAASLSGGNGVVDAAVLAASNDGVPCGQILDCYELCNAGELGQACIDECFSSGLAAGQTLLLALSTCFDEHGCSDQFCLRNHCQPELDACEHHQPPAGVICQAEGVFEYCDATAGYCSVSRSAARRPRPRPWLGHRPDTRLAHLIHRSALQPAENTALRGWHGAWLWGGRACGSLHSPRDSGVDLGLAPAHASRRVHRAGRAGWRAGVAWIRRATATRHDRLWRPDAGVRAARVLVMPRSPHRALLLQDAALLVLCGAPHERAGVSPGRS